MSFIARIRLIVHYRGRHSQVLTVATDTVRKQLLDLGVMETPSEDNNSEAYIV